MVYFYKSEVGSCNDISAPNGYHHSRLVHRLAEVLDAETGPADRCFLRRATPGLRCSRTAGVLN